MKQCEGVLSSQKNINRLVEAVQNARSEYIRSDILGLLWGIVGKTIMGNMVGKSYQIKSDFDMFGDSPKERLANLAADGYLVFCKAVMTFDLKLGVPFLAYIAQKIVWKLISDKRANAKRTNHMVIGSRLKASSFNDSPEDPFIALLEKTSNKEDVEGNCFRKDAVLKIKQVAASEPKITAYIEACQELCNQGYRGSDAEVARHMGCTRASTGIYRKKLVRLLAEKGMDFNSLVAAAA